MSDKQELVETPEPMAIGPRRTPDEWARIKGMPFAMALISSKPRVEELRNRMLEGAKMHNKWVQGELLTEAEFDDGMAGFEGSVIR